MGGRRGRCAPEGQRHRFRELAAEHPEIPQDRAGRERGQLDGVGRDDIAVPGGVQDDWPSYRRHRMPVVSWGEWCRDRADILDIVDGAACLDRELIAGTSVTILAEERDSLVPATNQGEGECWLESLRSR